MLTGPDGRRVTVAVRSTTNTVGDLADSLGLPRRSDVLIDGRQVERRLPLDRAEIAQGSRLTDRSACRGPSGRRGASRVCGPMTNEARSTASPRRSPRVVVVTEAGPSSGSVVELGPGRHVVGRAASTDVRVADDLVELHHAVIDVDDAGAVTLTQIAGRVPCRVSTAADSSDGPLGSATHVLAAAIVSIGASRLRLDFDMPAPVQPASLTQLRGDPWRRSLHRTPRALPLWDPTPIAVPVEASDGSSRAGGLLAAMLAVVGGVAVAVVMKNPLFLVFAGVGFVVAVGNRLGGRLSDRRQRKQSAAEAERERQRFADDVANQLADRISFHRSIAPTVDVTLTAARSMTGDVWSRRALHDDAFTVAMGWGTESWTVSLGNGTLPPDADALVREAQRLEGESVLTTLGSGQSLAIAGHHGAAVARSLVVQLATWTGPADWRLLVVVDNVDEWEWCGWLPHASSGAGSDVGPTLVGADDAARLNDVLSRLDDGDGRHVLLLTDRADLLSTRTGPLRRYLGATESVAVIAVVASGVAVPSMCRSLLEVGTLCHARWCPDTSMATTSTSLHVAGVSLADADDVARRLARLHDPEDPFEAGGATPADVSLSNLLKRWGNGAVDDPIAIAAGWRSRVDDDGAVRSAGDGRLRAAIGLTADGVVEIDLVRDGPHALIAGTTGSGKSELLRTLVVSMAARSSPDELTFVLVDYKGGSTFDACADLPHTVGLVTDLDDRLAERALTSLDAEIRRRERLLRDVAADNLDAYRVAKPGSPLPRLVVVIDEFAAMAAELPGFVSALVGVAQRGRSLGIHLVLATQRPAGVVSDEIRANTNLRIALRLQDRSDAMDIVGDAEPSTFARGMPGRAMMRLGPGETLVFQTAHSSGLHQPAGDRGLRVLRLGGVTDSAAARDEDNVVSGRHRSRSGTAPSTQPGATELIVLTRSIRGAASLCEIAPPFRPWLEPLADPLDRAGLTLGDGCPIDPDVFGLIDDPAGQRRLPLRWNRGDGNLALAGSFGSGTTTALKSALIAAGVEPHIYAIDARGDGGLEELESLPNCGGVIGVHDAERRSRLLRMLDAEIATRQSAPSPSGGRRPFVLAVDGLPALHTALSGQIDMDEHARLVRIVADGVAVGVHTVATFERPGGVPASLLAAFGQRWLFHLDDPSDTAGLGVKAAMNPPAIPGRIVVASTRLEAQIAQLPMPERRPDSRASQLIDPTEPVGPASIGTLPDEIDAAHLAPQELAADGSTALLVGVDFATLGAAVIDVPDGEHAIILGPARSGRSTALIRVIAAWRAAHPDGAVFVRCPRRTSPVLAWLVAAAPDVVVAEDDAAIVEALGVDDPVRVGRPGRHVLIAIDDAERVDDLNGALLALVSARHAEVMVVAAGRPDTLRTMYGHWTAVVRRSRLGIVMTKGGENDGELLGELLPRRIPVGARPGLAWLFDANGRRLIQVATDGR